MSDHHPAVSHIFLIILFFLTHLINAQVKTTSTVVPLILDHNRILVDGEIQRKDGSWRKVRFWLDTGTPDFIMSESLARDLQFDLTKASSGKASFEVLPPAAIRLGSMDLNFENIKSKVVFRPFWLFSAMHNDANIPASVLKQYSIIIDYPDRQLHIGPPDTLTRRGIQIPAEINKNTGVVQVDVQVDDEQQLNFAVDLGASYSFISDEKLKSILEKHPQWEHITGTAGYANMWGWWPANEETFQLVRIPVIKAGELELNDVGITGVPPFTPEGPTLGEWYSQKTARPVDGFLGANAFKGYRIEIDYPSSRLYLDKISSPDNSEMNLVGISLRILQDQTYQVVGVVTKNGNPLVAGVEPGDILLRINDLDTKGLTMGTVTDALRGKPGDIHKLTLIRNGKEIIIPAKVSHCL